MTTSIADPSLTFAWLPAPWLAPLLLAAAVAAGVAAWRFYGPAPGGAWAGRTARLARALAIALVVLAAGGPVLDALRQDHRPGSVAVAIDASASMAKADVAGSVSVAGVPSAPAPAPGLRSRLAVAVELAQAVRQRTPADDALVTVHALCRSDSTSGSDSRALDAEGLASLTADGGASPIADDLDRLVRSRRRPDALVVVSDGRITSGATWSQLAASWQGRELPTYLLAVGGEAVVPSLAIEAVECNREAALGEVEPIQVTIAPRSITGAATVEARIDGVTGAGATASDEMILPEADPAVLTAAETRLGLTFLREGSATITVTVRAGGLSATRQVPIRVRPRKLSVLVLDRVPRYEIRYLREAFRRDRTVLIHAYLADGRWRRWSDEGPDRLPLSAADLAAYDVVLLGDLGPDALSASNALALAKAVRSGGLGLVWLPGDGGQLSGWVGTPLGELIPADLPDGATLAKGYSGTAHPLVRTPTAERLGLLEPGDLPWDRLPLLYGAATLGAPRPGAEVLAEDGNGRPLVLARDYGAGRALLIAVDDTWRWRLGRGDQVLHRFHSQLIRWAAANHRGDRKAWRLAASPRRVLPGEAVTITATATRDEVERPARPAVRLHRLDATSGAGFPAGSATTATTNDIVIELGPDGDGLGARIIAPAAGTWGIEPARGLEADNTDGAELDVQPPQGEARDPRADSAALAAFAQATGARLFHDPQALLDALPKDLRHTDQEQTTTSLWDRWWLIAAVLTLLTVEWALRRWHRLP